MWLVCVCIVTWCMFDVTWRVCVQPLESVCWQNEGVKFISAHSDSSLYYWSVTNSTPHEGPTKYYGQQWHHITSYITYYITLHHKHYYIILHHISPFFLPDLYLSNKLPYYFTKDQITIILHVHHWFFHATPLTPYPQTLVMATVTQWPKSSGSTPMLIPSLSVPGVSRWSKKRNITLSLSCTEPNTWHWTSHHPSSTLFLS